MSLKKVGLIAATTVAAGLVVLGGSALASAAPNSPSPNPSSSAGYGGPGGGPGRGAPASTVTGDEATKVTNAVKAKDSTVTVTAITKDSDGSYDVFGTRNGTPVKYDVSTDLKTITQDTNGPGGHGGPGDPGGVPGSAPSGAPGN